MGTELFVSAKLKLEHANQHIIDLHKMFNAFLNSDFYTFGVEKDANSGNYVLQFRIIHDAPIETTLILGDAVHDMRAALDHLMWELVSLCGITPTKEISFPISQSREGLTKTIENGKLKRLGTDIVDLMVDGIKSYKGGDDLLFSLDDLDNIDKHRLLIPVYSFYALTNVTANAGGISFIDCTLEVGEQGKLNLVGMPGEFEFRSSGKEKPLLEVVFGKGQPFEDQPIIPTLTALLEHVNAVVQRIEAVYRARE